MNTNAANALLKNLEEPPPGMLFILVSQKPQQLLPTILSRCLSFVLPAPDAESAMRWLAQQGVKTPAVALAASWQPALILLSAKTGEQLLQQARLLREELEQGVLVDADLVECAVGDGIGDEHVVISVRIVNEAL